MPTTTNATDRLVTCRYLRRSGMQCTAEAVDDQADVLLCTKHLARAMSLLAARGGTVHITTERSRAR